MIAVSEAYDSGLCAAGAVVRQRFASDLDNLTIAAPDLNRHEKRDHDAAEWLPENDRCWFAAAVAEGVDRPGQMAIKNAERAIYASATAFVAEAAGVRRCARRRHCEQYGSREGFAGRAAGALSASALRPGCRRRRAEHGHGGLRRSLRV